MPAEPRVLIIENDDVLRAMLFTVFRHQPLGVDTASTAAEAIEKILSCDYALIVIDMNLPDGESERFLRAFKVERPESTSFVIAVRDPRIDVSIDVDLVMAVVNKPLEIDVLAEVVRECAFVVPKPENPLACPPSEGDLLKRSAPGSSIAN